MQIKLNEEYIEHQLFNVAMWWRIGYGAIRTIIGFMLLRVIDVPFSELLMSIMRYELAEDPTDMFFGFLISFLQTHPFSVTYFLAAYFIFWGLTDVILSACLLKHKLWAFPVSLWLIAVFVLYEIYRFIHTHSLVLLTIILVDMFIFWLISEEYKKYKRRKVSPLAPIAEMATE